jgi:hypothetical protein
MSRKSTGTVGWRPDPERPGDYRWHARYTRSDRSRTPWYPLDPSILEHDDEGARRCALQFASAAKATTKDGKGESVAAYSVRWLAERKTRLVSVKDDTARLRDHVLPIVGQASVLRLTRHDVEGVRDALDDKVAKGEIAWKTARCAWTVFKTMCDDMANARRRELRSTWSTASSPSTAPGTARPPRPSRRKRGAPAVQHRAESPPDASGDARKGRGQREGVRHRRDPPVAHLPALATRSWRHPSRAPRDPRDEPAHHLARPESQRGHLDGGPGGPADADSAAVRARGFQRHGDLHPGG